MLFDFQSLCREYKMNIRGVMHIGAHYGKEYFEYKEAGIEEHIFFEPLQKNFKVLQENMSGIEKVVLVNKAVGNTKSEVSMYVESANKGQSSSVLLPQKHLEQYPHIQFFETEMVEMIRLDDFLDSSQREKYNLINIDVQGYELEVFKGATKLLEGIDYIISEVNRAELYSQCALIGDVDEFLGRYEFTRVATNWGGITWGDALYIKGAGENDRPGPIKK